MVCFESFCENCMDEIGTSGNLQIYQLNTVGVIHKVLVKAGEKSQLSQLSQRSRVASSELMKMSTSHTSHNFGDTLC